MAIAISPTFSLTPSSTKSVLSSNYITSFDYLNQYLPEVNSKEFERYGNRSISGTLAKLSAEVPYSSDLVKWSEEGRLHTAYTDVSSGAASGGGATFTKNGHVFRANETVILSKGNDEAKAFIVSVTTNDFVALPYVGTNFPAGLLLTTGITAYVFGSEFAKGTDGMVGSLEAQTQIFENKGIILKDLYEVSGSDMAQIGWIEVTDNSTGQTGFLWYLKSKSDTVQRFADKLEMAVVEGVKATSTALQALKITGTEGFFSTISTRGNVHDGLMDTLAEFDGTVDRLNKQGAIEENMIYCSTAQDRAIDDMLASQNAHFSGGAHWGTFPNGEAMALDLGFKGFMRSGYSFYKKNWKYLNDATTRSLLGGTNAVHGVVVPAGTKSVYDEVMGGSVKQPFLHIKYRKSATEDRKYKTWLTGSAGGANNSSLDAMQVNFLSERLLCTLGANNFVLIKG